VLLNITADHLDRYPTSTATRPRRRAIFAAQTADDSRS
jgi:UDP-N-acetylmuramoylalanine-D-glutamate ligase